MKRNRSDAKAIDRRAARTRKTLHQALMSLILRRSYDALTVQDIIDEANVGRSTFYAHYSGKEELMRSGFEMLRAELETARKPCRAGTADSSNVALPFSRALFEHANRYVDAYRALAGSRGSAITLNEIRRILTDVVRREIPGIAGADDIPLEIRVQFVVSAFLTVLTWWLERQPRMQPEAVDGIFRRLVLQGIGCGSGAVQGA